MIAGVDVFLLLLIFTVLGLVALAISYWIYRTEEARGREHPVWWGLAVLIGIGIYAIIGPLALAVYLPVLWLVYLLARIRGAKSISSKDLRYALVLLLGIPVAIGIGYVQDALLVAVVIAVLLYAGVLYLLNE
jgi:hypothetical protein